MDKTWYYVVDGQRFGPVTIDELRGHVAAGVVKPFDLVWQPEFGPDWRNAGQVRELFADRAEAVPGCAAAGGGGLEAEVPLTGVTGERPSAFGAAAAAFGRMVEVLFRPFDIARWFSVGFCAWLAYLGTLPAFDGRRPQEDFRKTFDEEAAKQAFDQVLEQVLALPQWETAKLVAAGVGLVFGLLFALLFCNIRSRGDFMFLHRWYCPDASIRSCWGASKAAGRELYVWRVYFFLIAALLFAINAVFLFQLVLRPYADGGMVWDARFKAPAAACLTALLLLVGGTQLVSHLAKAFVVPVMYWHGVTASRAWLAVFALCNQYPFAVLGYIVCGIACAVVAVVAIVAAGLMTCCIGFLPLMLPYFGCVVLLPYFLFFRGYAVCFLNRWRPELVPQKP